jgi:hypothetical protein
MFLVRLDILDNSYFLSPFSSFSVYYVFLRAASTPRLLMYALKSPLSLFIAFALLPCYYKSGASWRRVKGMAFFILLWLAVKDINMVRIGAMRCSVRLQD